MFFAVNWSENVTPLAVFCFGSMPFVHRGGKSCDTMVHVTTSAVLLDNVA